MVEESKYEKMIEKEESKEVNIHYDKQRQIYTIRIPVAFAKAVMIDDKKDKFKFLLIKEYSKEKEKPVLKLAGELVHD